ncbi:hypothetical protein ACP4OV_005687 [Aristida adscensionis]
MGSDAPPFRVFEHPIYGVSYFAGWGYLSGLAGGAVFHFARGLCRSPRGARLAGAARAACAGAPRAATALGAYCAVIWKMEDAVRLARRGHDDIFTGVAAVAATGGLHGVLRGGWRPRRRARGAPRRHVHLASLSSPLVHDAG